MRICRVYVTTSATNKLLPLLLTFRISHVYCPFPLVMLGNTSWIIPLFPHFSIMNQKIWNLLLHWPLLKLLLALQQLTFAATLVHDHEFKQLPWLHVSAPCFHFFKCFMDIFVMCHQLGHMSPQPPQKSFKWPSPCMRKFIYKTFMSTCDEVTDGHHLHESHPSRRPILQLQK